VEKIGASLNLSASLTALAGWYGNLTVTGFQIPASGLKDGFYAFYIFVVQKIKI